MRKAIVLCLGGDIVVDAPRANSSGAFFGCILQDWHGRATKLEAHIAVY